MGPALERNTGYVHVSVLPRAVACHAGGNMSNEAANESQADREEPSSDAGFIPHFHLYKQLAMKDVDFESRRDPVLDRTSWQMAGG